MTESTLSRRIAQAAVEALRSAGHVLVTRGGAEPLIREIDALAAPTVMSVVPRVQAARALVGEPTTTFGDERADEEVEELIETLASGLMASDHVEDVFAEDRVIKRDLFRIVRDALLSESAAAEADAASACVISLQTLGYVAKVVAERADPELVDEALGRAAEVAEAKLESFDRATAHATFRLESTDPDARLELEEAVFDELSDLVDRGSVELPWVERSLPLPAPLSQAARAALRPKLQAAAESALERSGCAARWAISSKALALRLTPLAEHEPETVERKAVEFLGEIAPLVNEVLAAARPTAEREPADERAPDETTAAPRATRAASDAPRSRAPVSDHLEPTKVKPAKRAAATPANEPATKATRKPAKKAVKKKTATATATGADGRRVKSRKSS